MKLFEGETPMTNALYVGLNVHKDTIAVAVAEARVATLDQAIGKAVQTWRFTPGVDALRARRGVAA
jgi:hypothetical protein